VRGFDEHRAAATALVTVLPTVEVPLLDALGLVLAADVTTGEALPRWDNSAMDGYAVRAADVADGLLPAQLHVVGEVAAGSADEPAVQPGTAVRIMTGAPVPPGADAVVPVELTRPVRSESTGDESTDDESTDDESTDDERSEDGGTEGAVRTPGSSGGSAGAGWADVGSVVEVRRPVVVGQHVRRAGEDATAGDVVLTAGAVVGPAHVAAAASVGRATLFVHRRPRIAVVSTGDELVPPGDPLRRGQIPDSNSWLLAAAVRDAGADALRIGPVDDDPAGLHRLLVALDAGEHGQIDGIVTSGGVSAGAFDVVKAALADEPGVEFVPVAVQPGKPQGLGRLARGTPVWTLPGNPVSSFASFEVFVRPALRRLLGDADGDRPRVRAVADEGWRTPAGRTQLMPVRRVGNDEPVRVRPATARGSGSHLVARLALAQGLAVVPADVDEVRVGDTLEVFWT